MKGKIVAGLLALTVAGGVEHGLLMTAQAAEQMETVAIEGEQNASADQVETENARQPQPEMMTTKSSENNKAEVKKEEAVAKNSNDKKKAKVKRPAAPLTIEGDELYFDDHTGEVHARGKVVVTQNPDSLLSEEMRGNTKTTEVWIDGKATIIQPEVRTTITGHTVHYNYGTKYGEMAEPHGMIGAERVQGKDALFYPDKLVAHEATMTRCPAKVPDYHTSATKVEIWPGDKLIAYNAKVWIKNTVIYSVAKYQRSLKDGDKSEMPRIGYSNKDGISVHQYFEYPLTKNWAAATEQSYYSKHGYKPQFALVNREAKYVFRVDMGDFRDSDNNWVKKEPEFRFDWSSTKIGKLPWSYTFSAVYGKWTDPYKTSWHQDYILYFTRDPIKLSKTLTWSIGTGIENIRESYNASTTTSMKFNTTLFKVISPKFCVWTTYNYTKNNQSIFDYGSVNVGRELVTGFSYAIDRMNTIAFSKSYDLEYKRTYSDTWTWYRNLHCWNMSVSIENKKVEHTRKITWDLSVARW